MRSFTSLAAAILVSLSIAAEMPAQTVSTDPVGFITLNIKGTSGFPPGTTSALSFLGLGMTQLVAYQAALSSASGNTLVDSNATWTDNQFNGATNNHYVELLTGGGAGRTSQITGTSASGKSITTADNLSSFVTPGTTYRIRKNWTLASLFGPNNEAGLQGGTSTTADEILVLNQSTGLYKTYYYKTSGLGGTGWRSLDSNSVDVSTSAFFKPVDGLLIRRHQSADIGVPLVGAVKLGQTAIPIGVGLNIVSNPYPSGTLTLATSGLQSSGIGQGTSTSADLVQILNTSTGLYDTYYYKNSGLGGTGWRSLNSNSIDEASHAIPFGVSVIIQRKVNSAFTWVIPQPFTYP